ncbi:MAG TPA: Hsp70 family protein [Alphaproteobacteria bacterium]|nr:Hsp70 family protein [Alphaproteobacteria bacterium]
MIACGLDFGTSNSAVGVLNDGRVGMAELEDGRTLIPSALFFDEEMHGRVLFGEAAVEAYIGQSEGRLMRALKSILGTSLIEETTVAGKRTLRFTEIIEIFIRHLKTRAEVFLGQGIEAVVHGRPVRFVDDDDAADARAQRTLEEIARRVGFKDVSFVYEPIAAAYDYERNATREEVVLIADIGGGTSDFTVIRIGPDRLAHADRESDILANAGVHIGGTDFDALFSMTSVMPVLGLGSLLVEKDLPMPRAPYDLLATWAKINFSYTPRNERLIAELVAEAAEPRKVARLQQVVRRRLGHRLAIDVEKAKVALSGEAKADIPLDFIELRLHVPVSRADFEWTVRDQTTRLRAVAGECVAAAGLKPNDIGTIFFTGGSSRIPAVREAIAGAAPEAVAATGSDFLSVAAGLTLEAQRRYR